MRANPKSQYLAAGIFPTSLVLLGMIFGFKEGMLEGLVRIVLSPSALIHDYIVIGGLYAAFLNAGILGLLCIAFIAIMDIDLSGPFIAALHTVIGFAFFGKNLLNVWPIILGVWLYSRANKSPFRNYALLAIFGTTLSPIVSVIAFGGWLSPVAAIIVAMLFGTTAGFVLPPLASHMLRFHDGYNIYNVGFTGGIIGSFLIAILRGFGYDFTTQHAENTINGEMSRLLLILSLAATIACVVIHSRHELHKLLADTRKIYKSSGRLVSDFTVIGSMNAAVVNMGIMGLISCVFVLALGGAFSGPVIGGILTVTGFGAFGKHPINCIPVMLGVFIAASLKIWDIQATSVIIAGLFGTTLAPISGSFGPVAGLIAGFIHLSIVHNVGILHGGVNLYNNGFSGGFVASFLVPIINAFSRKESNR